MSGIDSNIRKCYTIYVILPPLAYVFYAAVGYVCNWQFARGINYPYFFLNWGSPAGAFGFSNELPFMGCMRWILLLLVLLLLTGALYLKVLELLKKALKSAK